jgi:hypothetical protein
LGGVLDGLENLRVKSHHHVSFDGNLGVALLDLQLHPLQEWLPDHCGGNIDDESLMEALCFLWYWQVFDEIFVVSEFGKDVFHSQTLISWAESVADLVLLEIYKIMS